MIEIVKPFNFILACDTYKTNHFLEMPDDAKYVYVVCVPRKPSKYADEIVAIGQTFVGFMLSKVRITEEMIDEAEIEITQQGYEFNRKGWEYISRRLDGKLPIAFYGVEEGRVIKPQTPQAGWINTDPHCGWLPGYIETWTQSTMWKMSTVASICRVCRITIKKYMEMTGAVFYENGINNLDYKLHNFGDRGADSPDEAAVLAGISHAALFNGSDCTRANGYIKKIYNTTLVATSSIEATEHSVMTMHSDPETRDDFGAAKMVVDRLHKVVERTKRGIGIPLLSVVIDTYNSRRFVRNYLGITLKDKILASGGKLIMRPDSGNPTIEPGMVGRDIEETFGVTKNQAGYKVLHPQIGVIQGDGNRIDTYEGILKGWVGAGFSMDSFVLGMGSGITHDGGRDDFSYSVKAVAWNDGNRWMRLLKEPNTDVRKKSLSGLIRCAEDKDGNLEVYDAMQNGLIHSFFHDGPGWRLYSQDGFREYIPKFESVRERARAGT